jgi:multicomponent Na+:H+ antiporter subunit E
MSPAAASTPSALVVAIARRGLLLTALWWALSGGDFSSPLLVAAVIAAANAVSIALIPPLVRWPLLGTIRFAGFFVRQSVLGGLDVARRAMHLRHPPLEPELVERRLILRGDAARVFFTGCVSLLPGTLSAALDGGRLTIHVLDVRLPYERTLDLLERRVAELFDEPAS